MSDQGADVWGLAIRGLRAAPVQPRGPMPRRASFDPQLALLVLEQLDDGLVVCAQSGEIAFANAVARTLLGLLGWTGGPLPAPMQRAVAELDAAIPGARPVVVPVPGGQRLYLKQKLLRDHGLRLLYVRPGVRREIDLRELLVRSHGLTPRECDLVLLMRSGLRNQALAEEMKISLGTLKYYASRVYTALGVGGRAELMALLDRMSHE